jgi:hypothetical protein
MGKNRQHKRLQGSPLYAPARPKSIADLDISPNELIAILQLVEESLDLGVWSDEGVALLSASEAAKLWEKLVAIEDKVDCEITNNGA